MWLFHDNSLFIAIPNNFADFTTSIFPIYNNWLKYRWLFRQANPKFLTLIGVQLNCIFI